MINCNLWLFDGDQNFPGSESRYSTDRIAGSFSASAIAFSSIKLLFTINASTVVVNENYTTTVKINREPIFKMAGMLAICLVTLVQNSRPGQFYTTVKSIHF